MGVGFLLATWGDPSGWALARYTIDGRRVVESFSSTQALAELLSPERLVVLAPDTLIREESAAGQGYWLGEASRRYVEHYLCGLEARVEILPGIITSAGGRFRVRGEPADYYKLALLTLARMLLGSDAPPSRVALDITHGINFMPSLSLQAAGEALAYVSLARALKGMERTRLDVYNSDPYIRHPKECKRSVGDPCSPAGDCNPEVLGLHRIISTWPGAPEIFHAADSLSTLWRRGGKAQSLVEPRTGDPSYSDAAREINRSFRETLLRALALLKSFRHGLVPQVLAQLEGLHDFRVEVEQAINTALDLWKRGITTHRIGGNLTVERRLRLGAGFELLTHAWSLATALEPLAELGPTLEAADRLKNAYKRIGATVTFSLQSREYSKIIDELSEYPVGARTPLGRILCVRHKGVSDCEVFKRDLVAHGGWHSQIVYLTPEGSGIRVEVEQAGVCVESGSGREKGLWEVILEL